MNNSPEAHVRSTNVRRTNVGGANECAKARMTFSRISRDLN